jgi:hypothetical protein
MGGRIAAGVLLVGALLAPRALLAQVPQADAAAAPAATEDRSLEDEGLGERIEKLEAEAEARKESAAREQRRLEQRVEELESAKAANEDATRSIIASTLLGLGSRINEFVDFGGVIEVVPAWEEDLLRESEQSIKLNTAELQFEIQVADWARGSLVVEYDDGGDLVFTTTEDDEFSIDRVNIDTAFATLGNTQRFWPYASIGRMVVPFGISTGDPVADVLNIIDPLTVDVFETKNDAILVGFEFPTPPPTPEVLTPVPPPVRPLIAPLFGELARLLGYRPPPPPYPTPAFRALPPPRPPFRAGVYFYDGDTFEKLIDEGEWDLENHMGAMVGYQTRGSCRPSADGQQAPDDLHWLHVLCPWSLDVGLEFNRSVFDSDFLRLQYRRFLGPPDPADPSRFEGSIGFVPGIAASVKTSFGPVSVVGEWNGAIETVRFIDDKFEEVAMRPRAWQVSVGYQFDWNPSVEAIGAQGTYLTLSYSETQDLRGVNRFNANDNTLARVGEVPRKQLVVGAGEWVLPNVRLAVEYARAWDYSSARKRFPPLGEPNGVNNGAKRDVADAIFSMVTLEW